MSKELPFSNVVINDRSRSLAQWFKVAGYGLGSLLMAAAAYRSFSSWNETTSTLVASHSPFVGSDACFQYPKLVPNDTRDEFFKSDEFRQRALLHLQNLVHVPTVSYDDMGKVGEDDRFNHLFEFEKALKSSYPEVFGSLQYETVNTHGRLFTWKGSDESLKPMLFMAHQDVVPILADTADLWEYDPFSATYDGEFIWGRGAYDCKNSLSGVLDAIEVLLSDGFEPKRTIVLAFGFDEEIGGPRGAGHLSKVLLERYGPKSFFAVQDEGGLGIGHVNGVNLAVPAISEKGFYNAEITVHTPGGHSSMPPDHTGVGIIAQLVELIENTPYDPQLSSKNPVLLNLQCQAAYSETMDKRLKHAILDIETSSEAKSVVFDYLQSDVKTKYLVQTSQAIDIVKGGLKINALPEKVSVALNHRIDYHMTVHDVHQKLVGNAMTIARRNNLAVMSNGSFLLGDSTFQGYIDVGVYDAAGLNPAPVSPVDGEAWSVFAGTIRHVFEDFGGNITDASTGETYTPDQIIVAPSSNLANTDTRYYWDLSDNVWRFSPTRVGAQVNQHTVNERIKLDAHVEVIYYYHEYIKNIA